MSSWIFLPIFHSNKPLDIPSLMVVSSNLTWVISFWYSIGSSHNDSIGPSFSNSFGDVPQASCHTVDKLSNLPSHTTCISFGIPLDGSSALYSLASSITPLTIPLNFPHQVFLSEDESSFPSAFFWFYNTIQWCQILHHYLLVVCALGNSLLFHWCWSYSRPLHCLFWLKSSITAYFLQYTCLLWRI